MDTLNQRFFPSFKQYVLEEELIIKKAVFTHAAESNGTSIPRRETLHVTQLRKPDYQTLQIPSIMLTKYIYPLPGRLKFRAYISENEKFPIKIT